jgi:hypothetical protein
METNTEWPKNDKSHSAGKKIIQDWVEKYAIDGIISDNRLGVLSKKIRLFYHTIECDNR